MATFKFRLATLLKVREAARDERRAQLAQAYQADAVLADQQRQIARFLTDLEDEYRAASSPGEIQVDRLLEAQRHEMSLRAQRLQLQEQRQAVSQEIERRRAALAEANRDVKALENLRKRQHERYEEDQNRRQVRVLDEVAQQQVLRENRS